MFRRGSFSAGGLLGSEAMGRSHDRPLVEKLIAGWGVLCVSLLLLQATVRLGRLAIEPWLDGTMSHAQIGLYVAWVVFNAYTEGYRAFQLKFGPRVVARAVYLGQTRRPLHVVLALPFCMSLFHSSRRQLASSWGTVVMIVTLVMAVRTLPQPWRGIVDGGVVVGLVWGIVVVWWIFARYLMGREVPEIEDLPDHVLTARMGSPAE